MGVPAGECGTLRGGRITNIIAGTSLSRSDRSVGDDRQNPRSTRARRCPDETPAQSTGSVGICDARREWKRDGRKDTRKDSRKDSRKPDKIFKLVTNRSVKFVCCSNCLV